jgi:hypothetical protein
MFRQVALCVGLTLAGCATAPRSVGLVPFVTGAPVFPLGDGIEIEEIAGTRPRLEVGGVYVVTGRARLVSRDQARVALFSTGSGNATRTEGYRSVEIPKGESEFHLAIAIVADGDLHLMLSAADDPYANETFGGVYFRDPDRPFLFGGVQRVDIEPTDARR